MSTLDLLPQRVFRKYYAKLASAIRDPEWLAGELYSKALISQQTCESVLTTQGISLRQKVTLLLNHVDGRLNAERKPKHLLRFCDVLDKQRTLKCWARRMRAEYNHLERVEGQQHVESETDVLESTTDWSSESAWEVEIDGTNEELGLIILGSQLLQACWNIALKHPLQYITLTCRRRSCHNRLRMLLALSLLVSILVLFALQKLAPEWPIVPFYGSVSNTEAHEDDKKADENDLKIVPSSQLAKLFNDSSIPTFTKPVKMMEVRVMFPGDGLDYPLPDVSFLKDMLSVYFDAWEIDVSGECMEPPGFRKTSLDENDNGQQKPVVIWVEVKFLPWPPAPKEKRRALDIVKKVVGVHTQYLCVDKCYLEDVAVREKENVGFLVLN